MTNQNPYDVVPYASYPLWQTNPDLLRTRAYLFGMDSPNPDNARILEIGCASGNNIISIGSRYPNSDCYGIDLSKVQISEGIQRVSDFNLKNVKLESKSVDEIDDSYGKFDYIICHGVFSWVPKNIQLKILDICNNNLSEKGVAYISYNTLPGWSSAGAIRDMMKYHTAQFAEPSLKAQQARNLLKFIKEGTANNKNFYSDIIQSEIDLLEKQSDWYLLHEYLEDDNIQYYFHDFMELAKKHNLQYLCDINISTMLHDNFPHDIAKTLATAGDIIRMEQYIDFISNRRFRSTLLCHRNVKINRNINSRILEKKFLSTKIKMSDEIKDYDLISGKPLNFNLSNGMKTSTDSLPLIMALQIIIEKRSKPVSLEFVTKEVIGRAKNRNIIGDYDEQKLSEFLSKSFLRLVFAEAVSLHLDEGMFTDNISEKPKAYELARKQSKQQNWISNTRQEIVSISKFDKELLELLDGKHTRNDIGKILYEKAVKGELADEKENIKNKDDISKRLPELIDTTLNSYSEMALLVK